MSAAAAEAESDALYEALLWISEYPNRHVGEYTAADNDAVILAEYAREVLGRDALARSQR